MRVKEFLLREPIKVIALVTALHSVLFGLGYFLMLQDTKVGVLAVYMGDNAWIFGLALLLAGITTSAGLIGKKNKVIRVGSDLQATMWLFAFIIYLLADNLFFGVVQALFWTGASGYTAMFITKANEIEAAVKTDD